MRTLSGAHFQWLFPVLLNIKEGQLNPLIKNYSEKKENCVVYVIEEQKSFLV